MASPSTRCSLRHAQQGFAYGWVLMLVMVMGVYLAQIGEVWQTKNQRAKEAELMRVGDEIRRAIKAYTEQNTGNGPQYPRELADLVKDPRLPVTKRYLRREYKDPLTGEDWQLIPAPGGGFMGVYSKSTARPLKQDNFPQEYASFKDKPSFADWRFAWWPQGNSGRR
ncbi:membrane protein [Chitinilyticum litopenaei]|uniref:membrane protein n=1 Tax=Chitinilyticum litopenaei TaxID=1121276 RepID=UPI00048A5F85|nr:membrane protein [Chitinilyticum litopenaei]